MGGSCPLFATFQRLLRHLLPAGRRAAASPRSLAAIIYSRQGCHLCDEARQLLRDQGFEVQDIDIDLDPALAERYGQSVPVIVIDGKERFRGRVDAVLLQRLVEHRGK